MFVERVRSEWHLGLCVLSWTAALSTVACGAVAQQAASFPTADGGVVYADVYGEGERGVVLAHGARFDKSSWTRQAKRLARAGLRVVAIDFRGRGSSRGGREPGFGGLRFDVLAAVRWLRSTGVSSVSVVGGSMGGGAAAEAAIAAPGEIDRLVLLAHPSVDHPERLGGRKLFVTCEEDRAYDGSWRLDGIRRQFEAAPEPKRLLVLDCAAHAQFIFDTEQGEPLLRAIREFLLEE